MKNPFFVLIAALVMLSSGAATAAEPSQKDLTSLSQALLTNVELLRDLGSLGNSLTKVTAKVRGGKKLYVLTVRYCRIPGPCRDTGVLSIQETGIISKTTGVPVYKTSLEKL